MTRDLQSVSVDENHSKCDSMDSATVEGRALAPRDDASQRDADVAMFSATPFDVRAPLTETAQQGLLHSAVHQRVGTMRNTREKGRVMRKCLSQSVRAAWPILWLMFAPSAHAATMTVTNTADRGAGSLRDVIDGASAGDTVVFTLGSNATIVLVSPLTVNKNLVLNGAGNPYLEISGNGAVQVFIVNAGIAVTFANLTIAEGQANHGGGINNKGTITLIDTRVAGNRADFSGGGIYNDIASKATLIESSLYCNGANGGSAGGGGGIYNRGTLELFNTTFTCNIASSGNGGGIYNDVSGFATITGSTFIGNLSTSTGSIGGSGGGIYNLGTIVELANSTVTENFVGVGGAGGGIYSGGTVIALINSTISGNSSFIAPGGVVAAGVGIYNVGNAIPLANAIVQDCLGHIADTGGNLDSDISCGLSLASSKSNATLRLGVPTYNGGATVTILPQPGSDAIGHGRRSVCAAAPVNGVDQRGATRSATNCTSGAAEVDGLFMLAVNVTGNGSVSDDAMPAQIHCTASSSLCSAQYPADLLGFVSVTLTATPAAGSHFAGWSGDCASTNAAAATTLLMSSNRACTATFAVAAGSSIGVPALDRWAMLLLGTLAALLALTQMHKRSRTG